MKKKENWLGIVFSLAVCLFCLCVKVSAECNHVYELHEIPAGCITPGVHEERCVYCGALRNVYNYEPLGHDLQNWKQVQKPGCTIGGIEHRKCSRCDFYEERSVTATGHHYDRGAVTKEPTTTAMGRITYTCLNCGDTYQETIPKLKNPFVDVKPKDYFYDSVLWAANNGITNGVDMTHFAPQHTCTRGEMVTFLWRAEGCPEPASAANPFVDVRDGDYFAKAVLWAYHAGVTNGVDAVHFNPKAVCTRAQVVTFLHRVKGKPGHSGRNAFSDVSANAYYYDAVIWAADHGVTTGTGNGVFSPNQRCDRGQIVTFLYRARHL